MGAIFNISFMKQPIMRKLLFSLTPILLGTIYYFGWRSMVLIGVVTAFGVLTEYLFKRNSKKPVTEAVIVTSVLFALTLPASTPFWVAIIGIVFGVAFAKEVFGGYGFNVFNPALAARTFLYICFPEYLTIRWNAVSTGFPGGFIRYTTPIIETVSRSTPLLMLRQAGERLPLQQLFWGNTSGSMGETSALLIIISAIILLKTKTADWKLMASPIIGFVAMATLASFLNPSAPGPLFGLFSGGFLLLSVFFVTEPITAPKTTSGKWIYGVLIGVITALIRSFGIFVEGAMFAVLIMNTFVPILDEGIKHLKARQKRKQVTA
ncbi:RnfABCDGE type electron transport complex subunit D [Alkaliphilus transvaalensis]|uniref:RnfABCDGE type electron transport complex subunit D n=1 Tax=Alkaliphilus transvaalensis TaxID=114628 RepID=UPI000478D339|nr:RnfABCDGE type electron transport complex subunit D [Alkaliphilus transvaalensis]